MNDTIWLSPRFTNAGECSIFAEATMRNNTLKNKTHTLTMHVLDEKPGIHFTQLPSEINTTVEEVDTLVFTTFVTGGIPISPEYNLLITPDTENITITSAYSSGKDTAFILWSASSAGVYTLNLFTHIHYSETTVSDTGIVIIRVFNNLHPSTVHVPEKLSAGKSDTLLFTVDNSLRPDPLTIELPADPQLDPAVYAVIPTGKDSLLIVVTPVDSTFNDTINIITGNGLLSDTTRYPVSCLIDSSDTVITEPEDTIPQAEKIPVSITKQPVAPDSIFTGDTVSIEVTAEGTPPPEYQWYKNNELVTGETSSRLIKNNVIPNDSGMYTVVVRNGAGPDITSREITIKVLTRIDITKEPENKFANEGETVTFSIGSVGTPTLIYQWLKDRQIISGEEHSSLTIAGAKPENNGKYRCIVCNGFSCDTSLEVELSVTPSPVYTVKFDTDGGTAIDSQQIKKGGSATRPPVDPTKSDNEFAGWYTSKTSATEFNFGNVITAPITIYAKWTPVYHVVYDANEGTGSVIDSTIYRNGDWVTVNSGSSLARSNYTFDKWTTLKNGSGEAYADGARFLIGSSSVTLWAQWKKNQCTITFDGDGATTLPTPLSISVDSGSTLNSLPTQPTKTGYVFNGWWTGEKRYR